MKVQILMNIKFSSYTVAQYLSTKGIYIDFVWSFQRPNECRAYKQIDYRSVCSWSSRTHTMFYYAIV